MDLLGGLDLELTAESLGLIWRNVWNRTAASTCSSVSGLVGVEAGRQFLKWDAAADLKEHFRALCDSSTQQYPAFASKKKKKSTLAK